MTKPEQLSMFPGPFPGVVTPMEAPAPTWDGNTWAVLRVVKDLIIKHGGLPVDEIARLAHLTPKAAEQALGFLAAYECALPIIDKGQHKWTKGRRSRDVYKHWCP